MCKWRISLTRTEMLGSRLCAMLVQLIGRSPGRMVERGLLTVCLVIFTGVAIGRGLQVAAEHYLAAPTALADSASAARAAGLVTLRIRYREGDGSEFDFDCLTTRDLVGTDRLFTEDLGQFEKARTTDCVATPTSPAQ
jgi:hypothetical protein